MKKLREEILEISSICSDKLESIKCKHEEMKYLIDYF